MTKVIDRRSIIAGSVTALLSTGAFVASESAPVEPDSASTQQRDPVLVLGSERQRLECELAELIELEDDAFHLLPDWAIYDLPLIHRGAHVPALAYLAARLARGKTAIELKVVKSFNRDMERVDAPDVDWGDGLPQGPESMERWKRVRAEGRARVRWWIKEYRAIKVARAKYEQVATAKSEVSEAITALEQKMARTSATSAAGIAFKLEAVFCDISKNCPEPHELLALSALQDLHSLAGRA